MRLNAFQQRIHELAQKWRTETINDKEYLELNAWFSILEDRELGAAIEKNVDAVEKRLHELLSKTIKIKDNQDSPPHPWHKKD